MPADLAPDQIDALRAALEGVEDPEYVARVCDVLWLAGSGDREHADHDAARRAVEAYLISGRRLEALDDWPPSVGRYTRALRLARQLGGERWHAVADELVERVRARTDGEVSWFTHALLVLLHEVRRGDPVELARLAEGVARRVAAEGETDRRLERDHWAIAARLWRRTPDEEREEVALVEVALSHRAEAEALEAAGQHPLAHASWEKALHAYRQRPSLKGAVADIRRRHAEAGRRRLDLMQAVDHEVDLTEVVRGTDALFAGLALDEGLYQLALAIPMMDATRVREETATTLDRSASIASLFPLTLIDDNGRTVAQRPGILGATAGDRDQMLAHDVARRADIERRLRAKARIEPALRRLVGEHEYDAHTLIRLIGDTEFVAPDRVQALARGLAAGFEGDLFVAVHLLVPQIEAGLRHRAEVLGEPPRTVKPDGTETWWAMDRLLGSEIIRRDLGEDLVFELEAVLVADFGPKLRHGLAHGYDPPGAFIGSDALTVWWLGLRLSVSLTAGCGAYAERLQRQAGD